MAEENRGVSVSCSKQVYTHFVTHRLRSALNLPKDLQKSPSLFVLLQEFIVYNKSSRWECRFTEAHLQEDKDICGSVTEH